MAEEMNKYHKEASNKQHFLIENFASECNDINQYIDKIDQYMQKIYWLRLSF